MTKYAFFLGCIMPLRYPGIESSTRQVLESLGVELEDMKGASCCPAPGVMRSFDQMYWMSIGARNLAIAERMGMDILTICNGCFDTLFEVAHKLNHDPELRKKVNKILKDATGMEYNGTVNVRHFVELIYKDIGVEAVRAKAKGGKNLKAAVHYGCHFLKPSNIKKIDDAERPHVFDDIVEAAGMTSVPYKDKGTCCGAGGGVRARTPDVALKMTKENLDNMKAAGAEVIVDCCPFCHLQYDVGQMQLKEYHTPVLHLSQLLGLAFGMDKEKLGLEVHQTKVNL
ncbi:MAG: CoB--CoM heterodisulfide reductase subunit B [Thermoplasmata archaeon]|nr:CoB--CoM heterodisulfide reductase subunit B [Thermoplasmata archaeon]MCJ7562464.1 CoB--CoM heterodisulfide reductase subunit B [Thermoplasmata archaeon]TFG68878.1 MAG: CoB--CoM heterodisulfide reductase subunit B [Methanomassiliicoccus sp.]